MIDWAKEHPILTFLLIWMLIDATCRGYGRTLRMINLYKNGYPPAHLDADGDWKPKDG